jgi:hypothetical protein
VGPTRQATSASSSSSQNARRRPSPRINPPPPPLQFCLNTCPFLLCTTPIKGPITPPPSPFAPSRNRRRASEEFFAGNRPVPRRIRAFTVESVSQSLRFLAPSPFLSSVHLLMLLLGSNLQRNEHAIAARSASTTEHVQPPLTSSAGPQRSPRPHYRDLRHRPCAVSPSPFPRSHWNTITVHSRAAAGDSSGEPKS